MTSEPKDPVPERRQPRIGTIVSAVLVAAILIAAAIAFAVRQTSPDPIADPHTAATPSATATPLPGGVAGFAVPEVDIFGRRVDIPLHPDGQLREQQIPSKTSTDRDWLTAPPAGLREPGGWQWVHGVVVPFSTSDGPTWIRDGVAGGYAHTPQGAALAAAMSVYQVAARPGDRAVLAQRLALTPADQARFDAGIAAGRLPRQQPAARTRGLLAYDAFRVETYAPDLAVVRLASRSNEPTTTGTAAARSWISASVPMVWNGTDWMLRGNGNSLTTSQISDLSGWTSWS